jgi:hypothetical protein
VPEPPLVRRRTAVLGAAATLLLAGCDHGDDIGGDPSSSGTPSTTGPSASTPPPTPDEQLVDQVTTELAAALGVLLTARQSPGLRVLVVPMIRAHRRHLEVLDGGATGAQPGGAAPPELRTVVATERRLKAALVEAAGKAESGALAKLLASISASVTQHLDALPEKA